MSERPLQVQELSSLSPAIVTGDFNSSPFMGRPDRAVAVGDRVIAHDGDPTVDDYWGTVREVLPITLPEYAEHYKHGLVTVNVTWERPCLS